MRIPAALAATVAVAQLVTAGGFAPGRQQPTFSVSVDLVTTDAMPRDTRTQQFISDLTPGEFEIYEDGVKQTIVSIELFHGARAYNLLAPPPAASREGIILPSNRPPSSSRHRLWKTTRSSGRSAARMP